MMRTKEEILRSGIEVDLRARFGSCKSYYGKARVLRCKNNEGKEVLYLRSYDEIVACFDGVALLISGTYSNTTSRHLKEFQGQVEVENGGGVWISYSSLYDGQELKKDNFTKKAWKEVLDEQEELLERFLEDEAGFECKVPMMQELKARGIKCSPDDFVKKYLKEFSGSGILFDDGSEVASVVLYGQYRATLEELGR